jgi:cysteine-rich repeat protein
MDRRPLLLVAVTSLLGACFSPNVPGQVDTSTGDEASMGDSTTDGSTAGSSAPTTTTTASDTTGSATSTDASTSGQADETTTTTTGPTPAVCGNGEVEAGEACDDGVNDGSYGGCAVDCSGLAPHCGDGVLNGAEPCDDGNDANGDGCNLDCGISGAAIWTRSFAGDPGFLDVATGVAVGVDDQIIVAGGVGTAPTLRDVLLLSYDADGSLLWDETYAFGQDSVARGVALDADGNIGITGDNAEVQVVTAMFDPDGGLLWSEVLANVGGGDIGGEGVAFDASGDLYVAGQVYVGSYDVSVRRYSEVGALVWAESYDGGLTDEGKAIALVDDAVFVSGGTFVTASLSNGWIRRYDLDGSSVWTREFVGPDNASAQSWGIAVDPNGNVVATGFSLAEDEISAQAWLRKYDLDGAEQWTEFYDLDAPGDAGFGVAVDDAGQIALVGIISIESAEPFVAKHAPDGTQLWIDYPHEGAVQPPGSVPAKGVAIDSQSNIIVAGSLDSDVWVRKYAP